MICSSRNRFSNSCLCFRSIWWHMHSDYGFLSRTQVCFPFHLLNLAFTIIWQWHCLYLENRVEGTSRFWRFLVWEICRVHINIKWAYNYNLQTLMNSRNIKFNISGKNAFLQSHHHNHPLHKHQQYYYENWSAYQFPVLKNVEHLKVAAGLLPMQLGDIFPEAINFGKCHQSLSIDLPCVPSQIQMLQ